MVRVEAVHDVILSLVQQIHKENPEETEFPLILQQVFTSNLLENPPQP